MNEQEQKSILTLGLMAAFADGDKDERERGEIKRIADSLGSTGTINVAALYQDVLLKRVDLATAVVPLASTEARQLAYEMAVCVCDADGVQSSSEQRFLGELRDALGLAPAFARDASERA
ncbi:MAG: DUF533 domain-containing protein, partial [Xanthomonadales bacterium]|nr:DUF533 domain-containing protein [Xanthomonadales bacterium]